MGCLQYAAMCSTLLFILYDISPLYSRTLFTVQYPLWTFGGYNDSDSDMGVQAVYSTVPVFQFDHMALQNAAECSNLMGHPNVKRSDISLL